MSKYQTEFILIRYGELALKGKNRKVFENQIHENMKRTMKGLQIKITRTFGRMYLYLNGESLEEVTKRLKTIFGIHSFSPAMKVELQLESMKDAALVAVKEISPFPNTFKVSVKRANKQFLHRSQELNYDIGAHILTHTEQLKVDVHHPDVEVIVEIREEACYIMCQRIQGAGGLPVGTSGKAMLMLSGGIDSPVAGYLAMKRGLRIDAVHFHSYPFTSERAKQKVIDLTKKLTAYGGSIRLHVVPFTKIQTAIREHIPEDYSITIMRRIMLRITQGIAEKYKGLGIVTGDNLGQVASQTMQSMFTINEVTNYPILRPLLTMDKLEIIKIAHDIDTYDISILPYEDCCTIFQPKSPKTRPTREMADKLERRLEIDQLVAEAIQETEENWYFPEEKNKLKEESIDDLF